MTAQTSATTPTPTPHRRLALAFGAPALLLAATALPGIAQAQQEMARVISSTPLIQQVAVPREICRDEPVSVPGQKSGAGALLGSIAGGAVGHAIGRGDGRPLATVIGVIGGAIVGDRIEGGSPPGTRVVRQCSTQSVYENRVMGYQVVYEYAGRQYSLQTPQEPGAFIPVQVMPVPPAAPPAVPVLPARPVASSGVTVIRYDSTPTWHPPGHAWGHYRYGHGHERGEYEGWRYRY